MTRRWILFGSAAVTAASMLAVSSPPAQARGCKAFGTGLAEVAQTGTLGQATRTIAPADDEIQIAQFARCAAS